MKLSLSFHSKRPYHGFWGTRSFPTSWGTCDKAVMALGAFRHLRDVLSSVPLQPPASQDCKSGSLLVRRYDAFLPLPKFPPPFHNELEVHLTPSSPHEYIRKVLVSPPCAPTKHQACIPRHPSRRNETTMSFSSFPFLPGVIQNASPWEAKTSMEPLRTKRRRISIQAVLLECSHARNQERTETQHMMHNANVRAT